MVGDTISKLSIKVSNGNAYYEKKICDSGGGKLL